jgi:transposase
MEEKWYRDRACLRHLRHKHPDWSYRKLAREMGYSYNWVRKWCARFAQATPDDNDVLHSQSRCPHHPPENIRPEVVAKILAIRDDPPENLNRIPGPVAIRYYLQRDEELQAEAYHLPTSTSTLWRILDENGRIERPPPREHEAVTRAAPMQTWQIDFKDVTTVTLNPGEKQMHLVETLDVVDTGTSILVDNQARADFNAETAVDSLAQTLQHYGCPQKITFDRDPRFIGSWTAGDFPSPLMRFLLCPGIDVDVCPPRRPDKNAFVERFHRTYEEEAIQIYRPATFDQVIDMNLDFRHHYNYERPNQALTCGNRPPRRAFTQLPDLPSLPDRVDPDRWLQFIDGKVYLRRIDANGTVRLDKHRYYIRRDLRGRYVNLQIDAAQRQILVLLNDTLLKAIPLKGLQQQELPFDKFLSHIRAEAVSQWRQYLQRSKRYTRWLDPI